MKAMAKRLNVLEAAGPQEVSLAVKQWLGWTLSDAEQGQLAHEEPSTDHIELTEEMEQWLAIV